MRIHLWHGGASWEIIENNNMEDKMSENKKIMRIAKKLINECMVAEYKGINKKLKYELDYGYTKVVLSFPLTPSKGYAFKDLKKELKKAVKLYETFYGLDF